LETKEGTIMPGTYKPYYIAINKHLIPFFQRHPVQLHEIQKDTIKLLHKELRSIVDPKSNKILNPKTIKNIINVLHTCLVDANESDRIPKMPGFPKKKDYQIKKKPILWITNEEKDAIFKHIPELHLPIFWWLRLSWRREGEAIALLRSDYDPRTDSFIIHRGISDRRIVERTKDGEIYVWPCDDRFKPYLKEILNRKDFSQFMFTCESSRLEGKRYSREILMRIWSNACAQENIKIDIHRGLRTSGASSAINEFGWSIEEAQEHGQWSDVETLKEFYGRYDLERIRALQVKKVVPILRERLENDNNQ
jgi:hypothetical protein